jgi:hypothetical protein
MRRIGKILVLLVFTGMVSWVLIGPNSAFADPPQPICGDDDPPPIEDWGDPYDTSGTNGDPDSYTGGFGANGSGTIIMPDDLDDFDASGIDPEDMGVWQAFLEYMLEMYYLVY